MARCGEPLARWRVAWQVMAALFVVDELDSVEYQRVTARWIADGMPGLGQTHGLAMRAYIRDVLRMGPPAARLDDSDMGIRGADDHGMF